MNDELPPVRHRVVLACTPEQAFALFTVGIARWWPFKSHSCAGEAAQDVQFEPRVGGQVTELARDGTRHVWGVLTAWQPPEHLAMTWHPGQSPALATLLSLRFTPTAEGCSVDLEHSGWGARGDAAASTRDNYQAGWAVVLGLLAAAAAGAST